MKTSLDCIPCFTRQALDSARRVTDDARVHEEVMRRVLELASRLDLRQPPPVTGQEIHRILRKVTGNPDPYKEVKEQFNRFALNLFPALKKQVKHSADRFQTAVRLAIAGNVIDFGVRSTVSEQDVYDAIEEVLRAKIDRAALEALREKATAARDILDVADNAGEIVFDRLLIEELLPAKVTLVVKARPVLNDATRDDAQTAGLMDLVELLDTGSDAPATILSEAPEELRRRFREADLILSKGQGNYESLNEIEEEVFFLLKAKCPVIAEDIGCKVGSVVVTRKAPAGIVRSAPK